MWYKISMLFTCIVTLCLVQPTARVAIVVEKDYYEDTGQGWDGGEKIDRYINEIESIDNISAELILYEDSISTTYYDKVEHLWITIKQRYEAYLNSGDPLEGAVLVGDLPIPRSLDRWYSGLLLANDCVYMDVYDQRNGQAYPDYGFIRELWHYDSAAARPYFGWDFQYHGYPQGGPGDEKFDIWVSRIYAENLNQLRAIGEPDEYFFTPYQILSHYFERIHVRRTQRAQVPPRAMAMGHIHEYISDYDNAIASMATGERREWDCALLCFDSLPVDETMYIANPIQGYMRGIDDTGGTNINSPANWQSQLQAGPYGNSNEGTLYDPAPASCEHDNRYLHWGLFPGYDSSSYIPDTRGYEWAGIFEHSDPWKHTFDNATNGGSDMDNGSFESVSPGTFHYVPDCGMYNNGVYYAPRYQHWYDHNKDFGRMHHKSVSWEFDKTKDEYSLYYRINTDVLRSNERFSNAWTQVYVDDKKEWGGWLFPQNDTLRDTISHWHHFYTIPAASMNTGNNHITLVVNSGNSPDPNDAAAVFIADAVKVVNNNKQYDVEVKDITDERFARYIGRNRYFCDMQDDGGQSKARFFLSAGCETHNFYQEDNIGLYYAMGHNGLISIGASTVNYADYEDRYSILVDNIAQNKCFGKAMLAFLNDVHFDNSNGSDVTNVVYALLGDGTLKPHAYHHYTDAQNGVLKNDTLSEKYTSHYYNDSYTIDSNAVIESGGELEVTAGDEIRISPEFHAEYGSKMHLKVDKSIK